MQCKLVGIPAPHYRYDFMRIPTYGRRWTKKLVPMTIQLFRFYRFGIHFRLLLMLRRVTSNFVPMTIQGGFRFCWFGIRLRLLLVLVLCWFGIRFRLANTTTIKVLSCCTSWYVSRHHTTDMTLCTTWRRGWGRGL